MASTLADQFTQNASDVHLIALAFDLSREPAKVLVFSDNTDIHKALRQLIHPRSAQYRRARKRQNPISPRSVNESAGCKEQIPAIGIASP